jgi:hypothetical protein
MSNTEGSAEKIYKGHPKTRKLTNFTIRERFGLNETILEN